MFKSYCNVFVGLRTDHTFLLKYAYDEIWLTDQENRGGGGVKIKEKACFNCHTPFYPEFASQKIKEKRKKDNVFASITIKW